MTGTQNSNSTRNPGLLFTLGVLFLLSARPAWAQTNYYWDAWDPAGTDFHEPTHWNPQGTPGAADVVLFDEPLSNRVVFSSSVTNSRAIIQNAIASAGIEMTFDIGDSAWNLTATGNTAPGLVVGQNRAGTMIVTNGTLNTGSFILGHDGAGSGTLILRGSNTVMTSSDAANCWVGRSGAGVLLIEGGAQADLAQVRGPRYSGGSTLVEVTDGGSYLYTGIAQIGGGGAGVLRFTGGASGYINHMFVETRGHTIITGHGTSVTGGTSYIDMEGRMTISDHATFEDLRTGANAIRIRSTVTNALLTVESGGTYISHGGVALGSLASNRDGTLLVRDSGSSLLVNDSVLLAQGAAGVDDHVGRLWIHTGGVARITGNLIMGDGAGVGQSFVEVAGTDARLTTAHAYVGGSSAAAGNGEALVTVAGGGHLVVTNAAGSGTLRVWESGALALAGGTITANNLDMKANATLQVSLEAAQIDATLLDVTSATAAIAGAVLEVSLASGYSPGGNDVFTLINTGWDGLFKDGDGNDLADGAIVWGEESGMHVVLNYVDNNDSITLTAIPEPGALALLALAGLFLFHRRRGA